MRALRLLDLTLPTPVENLALDEALLEEMDERGGAPVLRLWDSRRHCVVLGRSRRAADDVELEACAQDDVPILRRASGGGTVLLGPGCLSYAVIFPIDLHPDLIDIRRTYRFVLERLAAALQRWEPNATVRGTSDVAIDDRKISGNAQQRSRRALLVHGTILHGMSAGPIDRYLREPDRQPDYRAGRSHQAFLRTIDAPQQAIKQALAAAWGATVVTGDRPRAGLARAVAAVVQRTSQDLHAEIEADQQAGEVFAGRPS